MIYCQISYKFINEDEKFVVAELVETNDPEKTLSELENNVPDKIQKKVPEGYELEKVYVGSSAKRPFNIPKRHVDEIVK